MTSVGTMTHRPVVTYGRHIPSQRLDLTRRALGWFVLCMQRAQQRRALARLDARLLADIGMDPAEAAAEASKPFWQA